MSRVLAWWFLLYMGYSYSGVPTVVGPFRSEADCILVKESFRQRPQTGYSWCWWDGKP
jgi:hypothetical protein